MDRDRCRRGKGAAVAAGGLASAAFRDPGFALLTTGFFACGFQLAFLATHLPAYLQLCGLPMGVGATALAAIGLFNVAGSLAWGWAGERLASPQACLAALYALRALVALAYWLGPKTAETTMIFAAAMGLLWLGTVPLTSGLIARLFGTGQLGFLFGLAFLSHQLGSFLGALLGGLAFAATGSYDTVWVATVAVGLIAAALNLPIRGNRRTLALR
jgi:predicted MFS family arabinose efflux permease